MIESIDGFSTLARSVSEEKSPTHASGQCAGMLHRTLPAVAVSY